MTIESSLVWSTLNSDAVCSKDSISIAFNTMASCTISLVQDFSLGYFFRGCVLRPNPYVDIPEKDGALDALVCATIAYLFHFKPDELYFLRHKNVNKSGSGPFYVIKPPTT